MARLLLVAASAALLASTVRRGGGAGRALVGPVGGRLSAGQGASRHPYAEAQGQRRRSCCWIRAAPARCRGPGSFSVSASAAPAAGAARTAGTSARRVRLGAVRGTGTRSVWQADLDRSGNVCIANPSELGLYRGDASGEATVTLTDAASGKKADVQFAAGQWDRRLAGRACRSTSGAKISVTGLGAPATLTLRDAVAGAVGPRRHGAEPDPRQLPGAARCADRYVQRPIGGLATCR